MNIKKQGQFSGPGEFGFKSGLVLAARLSNWLWSRI